MTKLCLIAVFVVIALAASATAATAAVPTARQVNACLKRHGATTIVRTTKRLGYGIDGGWVVSFNHKLKGLDAHMASWAYVRVNGKPASIMTITFGLNRRERQAARTCTRS